MSSSPTVVVRKGGVLTAFVSGVFGTLIVCVICGAALGFYALNVADRTVGEVFDGGASLLQAVPELRESISIVADLLDDHRDLDYRDDVKVSARVAESGSRRHGQVVVLEVTNTGSKTVTLMTARVVVSDENGVPAPERRTCIATPVQIDEDEWRGPLLPGSERRYAIPVWDCPDDTKLTVSVEVTDLRVWNGGQEEAVAAAELQADTPPTP